MPSSSLPEIMVAPTGARRGVADHPAIPITIPQIVEAARSSRDAGAGGIHAHVRDAEGRHSLDAGLYRELSAELVRIVPDMLVQITTESANLYTSDQQRALVSELKPPHVSVALREMKAGQDDAALRDFYRGAASAGITVQHILYTPAEVAVMRDHVSRGIIPADGLELLFVLGQYESARDSVPDDLNGFLAARTGPLAGAGWSVCAFGRNETACLLAALARGGKARIGFENNLLNADGTRAESNAERVAELVAAAQARGAA